MRKVPLIINQTYHIFNRGVNKGNIFFSEGDYRRFFQAAIHYKSRNIKFSYANDPVSLEGQKEDMGNPKVQVLAYCFMPNHFHFLLKQLVDRGVTSYIQRLCNSYSHFVDEKYGYEGPLFQGRFKNVLIETQEQLVHVSRYIHLNPLISGLVTDLRDYNWSSYSGYIKDFKEELGDPDFILADFKSKTDYEKFVLDQANYAKELGRVKHLVLE